MTAQSRAEIWNGSWASSEQRIEFFAQPPVDDFANATLRQFVHLSVGGHTLGLRLSNAFGSTGLQVDMAHIAKAVSPVQCKVDAATDKPLTFSGQAGVAIPPDAEYVSDPFEFDAMPLSELAITLDLEGAPTHQTGHPGSRTSSCAAPGNRVSDAERPDAKRFEPWYYISAVDVLEPPQSGSVVILGDSMTGGQATTTDGNDRSTDVLAARLQSTPSLENLGVLNQGMGGNHLLVDGIKPNTVSGVAREVLAQTGVRYLIVLEGINDLGDLTRTGPVSALEHKALVQNMIEADQPIIIQAHAHRIRVFGATAMADGGSADYRPDLSNEDDRRAANAWIRGAGRFDGIIDMDQVTADPSHPDRLAPRFDSGDHLHPGPAGYKAMGDAVPLGLFAE
jgi:lysophospholipase L1-like esterase